MLPENRGFDEFTGILTGQASHLSYKTCVPVPKGGVNGKMRSSKYKKSVNVKGNGERRRKRRRSRFRRKKRVNGLVNLKNGDSSENEKNSEHRSKVRAKYRKRRRRKRIMHLRRLKIRSALKSKSNVDSSLKESKKSSSDGNHCGIAYWDSQRNETTQPYKTNPDELTEFQRYSTTIYTKRAVQYIKQHKSNNNKGHPLFMYTAF